MNQLEIHEYLKEFFIENNSEILDESPGHLHVQLSIEMDKALMNRPFYWHYIEKMNGVPNPMKLTLITDRDSVNEDLKGELIHFGSPRLHQIFDTATGLGSHVLLYESVNTNGFTKPLKPWIILNGVISYRSNHKKDHFFSIGLSLITGEMIHDIQSHIEYKNFTEQIPDYCFKMNPIIKPQSGLERIKKYIYEQLEEEDHQWAKVAVDQLKKDIALLETFYKDEEDKPETYFHEKEAIKEQYDPKIEISIINGGLFYFLNHPLSE
ncbi:YqhG family protein [Evansella sp. AB-P1]|uniref:YqhG family protein n=1 Tax=Evansella sp. AB-P1 TaxID=3037653 RepID=UPI00241E1C9C|nr:YqhG family protein [Evansella sp. AB-P1]MDG5788718.1 YqhG family protein [Evansella sp. AB-P1]